MSSITQPPREAQQRKHDTLTRLERDIDAWVASSDPHGDPYLVPLWYLWDGTTLTMATAESTPTGRNLRATGRVRLALGTPEDVVLVQGTVETLSLQDAPAELAEAFAARLFDARREASRYAYFRVTPWRIQAWRGEHEFAGRNLMRDGRWLV